MEFTFPLLGGDMKQHRALEITSIQTFPAFSELLWRKKRGEALKKLLESAFLKSWAASEDIGTKKMYERCRKSGVVSMEFLTKVGLFGQKYPQFKTDFGNKFLMQIHEELGVNPSLPPWELLSGMHIFAQALGMPTGSFPSIEELNIAASSSDASLKLMEKMAPFCSPFMALVMLEDLDILGHDYIKQTQSLQTDFPAMTISSIKDVERSRELLKDLRILRRTLIQFMRPLHETLSMTASEDTPVLRESLACTGMELAARLHPRLQAIRTELQQICMQKLAPEFNTEALRRLLDQIIPPLLPNDRNLAEEEINALDEGRLQPEQSPLFSLILPAIRGELEFKADLLDEEFPDFPYSHSLVSKLGKAIFSLKDDDAGESAQTPGSPQGAAPNLQPTLEAAASSEITPTSDTTEATEAKDADKAVSSGNLGYFSAPDDVDSQIFAHDTTHYQPPRVIAPAPAASKATQASDADAAAGDPGQPLASAVQPRNAFSSLTGSRNATGHSSRLDALLGEGVLGLRLKNKMERPLQDSSIPPESKTGQAPQVTQSCSDSKKAPVNKTAESEGQLPAAVGGDVPNHLAAGIRALMNTAPCQEGVEDGPVADPDSLYRQAVVLKDSCILYWLACSFEPDAPVPVWLAKLLHLGSHYQSCFVSLREPITNLCDKAARSIQDLDDRQKLLLAIAILRPALLMPAQSMHPITTILAILDSDLTDYGLRKFIEELRQFVRCGKPLEDSVFSAQSAQDQKKQKDFLRKETEKLFQRSMKGKIIYAPASRLRKTFFEKRGVIGKLLDACLHDSDEGLREFIDTYQDERNITALIDRSHARTSTNTIEASARQKLIDDIKLAVELAGSWLECFQNTAKRNEPSYEEQRFERLYAAMDRSRLQTCAEGEWFICQMEELHNGVMSGSGSPMDELELWPLRLACAYADEDKVMSPQVLARALASGSYAQDDVVAASLAIHMARGRLSKSADFLKFFPTCNVRPSSSELALHAPSLAAALPFTLDDVMTASREQWQKAFDTELETLKEYLGDSYFRGAILYDQQSKINLQICDIVNQAGTIPDMALAIQELKKLRGELQHWNKSSLDAVLTRIDELYTKDDVTQEAQDFLDELKKEVSSSLVFSAAWDNIARVENHLAQRGELPVLQTRETLSRSTAQEFYAQLEKGIPETADKASHTLWQQLYSLRNRRSTESTFRGRTTEFLRWLGFTLSQKEQPTEIFTSGSPNFWRVLRYSMKLDSPLPQWGSGARSQHVIAFGWDVSPAHIKHLLTSGYITAGTALTVICCGPLSAGARKEILHLSKSWPVFPLVIDSNLFHFLADMDAAVRTEKMFEVVLAGSPYNPYTPDVAGAVPQEMFFGREADKASVLSDKGACIIYGGRQLGKSALLQQIYKEYRPENSQLSPASPITVLQYTMAVQDTSLLDVVLKQCIKAGIVHAGTTCNTLKDKLFAWLHSEGGRRIIILLDECDSILDKDCKRGFKDVWILRDMMQESGRSFKVVFTGLHSVQRFSHESNNPLYHFGAPICIGPLSTDAAYGLMTKPMSLLGLEFATPQLVQMALNYCNYQPKLIQMFCSELVKCVSNLPSREPVHIIDKSTMLKVYDSQDLKTRIRDCFTMTLDLDKRYLVIGYVMALLQGENISIRRLQNELRSYWPAAFAAGSSGDVNTLQSLLHEMEGLGLVISFGGSYRLRTPNITELLGGQENVLLQLEQFYDRPYQPVADPDELRMDGADVFVASQYNLLADKSSRICWISGSKALGLDRVPNAIKKIAEKTENDYLGKMRYASLSGMTVTEAMRSLRGFYEKLPEGGLIVSISSDTFPYMAQFMKTAEAWLAQLRTDRKYVKIVCLVGPDCLYGLIREGLNDALSSYQMPLLPWTENSVDYWCKEKTLPGLNAGEIIKETGGWPCLTYPILSGKKPVASLRSTDFVPDVPELRNIVASLSVLRGEVFQETDIPELIDPPKTLTKTAFQQCLDLLKSLHILRETSKGLRLDAIAADAITGADL